jgi:hypothetical protein
MPLSSAVRQRCRAFLPPGEELRYLFPATSVQLGRGFLGVAPFLVAIADTQVIVLSCSWFRRNMPKSVWARYPRAIQLGPVDTSLAPTFTISNLILERQTRSTSQSSEPLTLRSQRRTTCPQTRSQISEQRGTKAHVRPHRCDDDPSLPAA